MKRRLTDLWITGRELTLAEDADTVWLQKLNTLEHAEAIRHADATRARTLAMQTDEQSDGYQARRAAVFDYGPKENLVEYLLAEDRAESRKRREAEVGAEEEWTKDNYLQGLRDSWEEGLKDRWITDTTDPEASRVYSELKRYLDEVDSLVEADVEDAREDKLTQSTEDLRDQMTGRVIEMESGQAWLEEFYLWELYLGVREVANHKKPYFVDITEVKMLSTAVYRGLRQAYEGLEVDPTEGKSLPEPPPSSVSSEPADEAAMVLSVGLPGPTA